MEALRAFVSPARKKLKAGENVLELDSEEEVKEDDDEEIKPSWATEMMSMIQSIRTGLDDIKDEIRQAKFQANIAQTIAEDAMDKATSLEVRMDKVEADLVRRSDVEEMITKAMSTRPPAPVQMHTGPGDKYSKTVVLGGFPRDTEKEEMVKMIDTIITPEMQGVEEVYGYRYGSIGFVRFETTKHMWDFLKHYNSIAKPKIAEKDIWAAVSKSPAERKKAKALSRCKRVMIEVGLARPDQVRVDYSGGVVFVNRVRIGEWKLVGTDYELTFDQNKLSEAKLDVAVAKLKDAVDELLKE